MNIQKMEECIKTGKSNFLMLAKKHPIFFLSFLIACFEALNSTALFSLYPEVFSNSLSTEQLFLVSAGFTSLLALIYIGAGLVFFLENLSWRQLSGAEKLLLGLIEFYIPPTFYILISGLLSFETHIPLYKNVVFVCAIIGVIIIVYLYKKYSWPLRHITVLSTSISIDKSEIKFPDYLFQRIFFPNLTTLAVSVLIFEKIFISKTELINFYSHQLNAYITFVATALLIFLPSYIIYAYRNIKSIVLGFATACVILTLLIPSKFSPTRRWLSANHIAYFNNYIFLLKKKGCHSLNLAGVQLQQLNNGACRIAAPIEVINESSTIYRIRISTGKLNEKVEQIKKEDIEHIQEKYYARPPQIDMDKIIETYAKLYNQSLMVLVKSPNHEPVTSDYGLSKSDKFNMTIKDKAFALGNYLLRAGDLISLTDSAALINKNNSGTIFSSLLTDSDNKFYFQLINRLYHSLRHGPSINKIEDISNTFIAIVKGKKYSEFFEKLGYWKTVTFNHEKVIELVHKEKNIELLLLYFLDQELTIAIAQNKMDSPLSLSDEKIQHLVHRILLSNEK